MPDIDRLTVDVPTGGHPLERVMEAFLALPGEGRGWLVDVCHDEGCPTQTSEVLSDCNCEILELVAHTIKRPLWKTDKVPAAYQPVESTGGELGWKPPLLGPEAPLDVRSYWASVIKTMAPRLSEWELAYWWRRVHGTEEPAR